MNPILFIDWYKAGHVHQYPKGITQVWSNWTPRTSRVPGARSVVNFGLNYFIKEYLQRQFRENFFDVRKDLVIQEYRDVVSSCLGVANPDTAHIEALHDLGYLPITIYSLPEGTSVPLNIPPIIITNNKPEFFWLPNYFETLLSAILWKPSTSATTARRYREIFLRHARAAGEKDFGFVDWQGHDFSMRGMSGLEDAILSGMGHLTCFSGTDTVPAILAANKYYGAGLTVGGSVPATEHSVMSAGSQDGEFETFKRLITEIYPSGIVSIVSDTWDLWKVLTDYVPRLKDQILAREGKIVIRPDSGDPVKIICGDMPPNVAELAHGPSPAMRGTLRLLREALGVNSDREGLPLINNAAAIYGDSITPERADMILAQMVQEIGISPYNMVFGIGSFTYEYCTRDTYGWAMKATAIRKDGEVIPIFKKPVTDSGGKFSHKGILAVYDEAESNIHPENPPYYRLVEETTEEKLNSCAYQKVFTDGDLWIDPTFAQIRERVRKGL